jgi:hypothetical protein
VTATNLKYPVKHGLTKIVMKLSYMAKYAKRYFNEHPTTDNLSNFRIVWTKPRGVLKETKVTLLGDSIDLIH